nr:cell wall protein DAN4-like [Labrus bergylta]XP_029138059.1 cell wall protein DAN4-like [Labrus bergylta]
MRMQLSINAPVVLLWGIFSLFSTVAMSAPNTENNMYTTGEPNKTTTQLSANVHNVTVTHQTHTPAEGGVATTKEMEIATITNNSSDVRSSDLVVTKSVAATTGGLLEGLLHSSAAATTTEAKSPNSMEMSETVNPTDDELLQQSTTFANIVTPSATSAASLATTVPTTKPVSTTKPDVTEMFYPTTPSDNSTLTPVSTQNQSTPTSTLATIVPTTKPVSTTKPDVTETFYPTTPSDNSTSTPVSTQNQSTSSTSATTTKTESTTSGVAPVFHSTIKEKSTKRTNPPSTSWPVSATRIYTSTSEKGITRGSSTEPPSTLFSMNTTNSTSPVGILIPLGPKTFATLTTKSAPTSPPSTDSQPCSSRGVVKHCLIAIASLAGLATFFMVTTITLCTKLSTSRYRVRRPPQATEMMCISSLLPERNYTYTRQRNPVSNGVLVMHAGGDSDEEGGDNLTLSSFLPENDHLV